MFVSKKVLRLFTSNDNMFHFDLNLIKSISKSYFKSKF